MRHRAPRHLPAFLRLQRVRPRRRLARLATHWHPSGWLPSRPSARLASALGALLLVLAGGVLAVGAVDDDTVPAVDDTSPRRSPVPSTSRSSDRPTLSRSPEAQGAPEHVTTRQHTATPEREATPDTTAPRSGRPEPEPSPRSAEPSLQAHAANPLPTDEKPSAPATPDLQTESPPNSSGHGPGTPTATTVDRSAPSTVLVSTPDERDDSATADFSFHADEDASFTCSLDGGAFRPCGPAVEYDVQPGWHDFAVRATDRAGNVEASPAQWHWHTSARD